MAEAGAAATASAGGASALAAPARTAPRGGEGAAAAARPGTATTAWQPGHRTFFPEALSGTFSFLLQPGQATSMRHLAVRQRRKMKKQRVAKRTGKGSPHATLPPRSGLF